MGHWLVTGGAGYIGSHVVKELAAAGMSPVVLDDLSTGVGSYVPRGVPLVVGSLLHPSTLERVFQEHQITGVIHLAGFKYAGVSVGEPLRAYSQNVSGMINLLEQVRKRQVDKFLFSSSAAVYGTPDVDLVTEDTPTRPESPYGESKLVGEWLLRDCAAAFPLRQTSLRYFNVVGAGMGPNGWLADRSPHNLFPLLFEAVRSGSVPKVFGNDYPTPDGTCVRDYVHVEDLAKAHVAAALRLERGDTCEPVYNLGSNKGTSVLEVVEAVRAVVGENFDISVEDRRPGDPARIVADGSLAARDLGWTDLQPVLNMVESAWAASEAVRLF